MIMMGVFRVIEFKGLTMMFLLGGVKEKGELEWD